MTDTGLMLDHRLLAALAREVEAADPIAWGEVALDRDTAYELIASQIAEMFAGYEAAAVFARAPDGDRAGGGRQADGGELRIAPATSAPFLRS